MSIVCVACTCEYSRVDEEVCVHLQEGAPLQDEGGQHDLRQVHPDPHLPHCYKQTEGE